MESFQIIKILILTTISFIAAFAWTPMLTHFLYKYKFGKTIRDSESAPIFAKLHAKKSGTPTMGGLLIWVTVLVLAVGLGVVWIFWPDTFLGRLSFLTRPQTLLPLGALVASAVVGLVDDFLNIKKIGSKGGGLDIVQQLIVMTLIAIVGAWWFYYKLGWDVLHVPFVGNFEIGWLYIPIFIIIIVATAFSVNETDGLDGLAGGTLLTSFGAFTIIAFSQGKYDLAAFCGVIMGALLAFLWFNINPARFFMGGTGSLALGVTLGIVAMLTNSALFLPIIGLVLVFESASVIVQTFSKAVFKRKIFQSTPIHHHFEAIGWPESKIVMRFWVISMISAGLGVALALLDALVT